MKKIPLKIKIIIVAVLAVLLFANMAIGTAKRTYEKKSADELERMKSTTYDQIDYYSMELYSHDNSTAVMAALKAGDKDALSKLMIKADGVDEVMAFADWSQADFENAVSMGSGSLTAGPDENGNMDVSERIFVNVGEQKYVFFIESLTSAWGRLNEGVSAVGVTTYEHFDATYYDWNGEKSDYSALAGELFWNSKS